MFAAVSIIVLLFFLTVNLKGNSFFVLSLVVFSLVFFTFMLITSQSRQSILGLIIALFICFAYFLICRKRTNLSFKKLISVFLFFLFFLASIGQVDFLKERIDSTFLTESNNVNHVLSGNSHMINSFGNGIRINSWVESIVWIKRNPIFGAGPNAIGEVIEQSDKFSSFQKKKINHLHSFHLEILVAYGILGALVIYGMYYWLIRSLVLAHRENPELKMYTVLGICFLTFWIIINFFESFSSRSYGVYVHNMMFGCLYTFYFTQQRKKIEEAEACA